MLKQKTICVLVVASALAPASPVASTSLEPALNRLYSFDFLGSREASGQYIAQNAQDPMGYALQAASYLFSELNRLDALSGPIGESKLKGAALKPDPSARSAFWQAVNESQRLALASLAKNPSDRNAMTAMAITSGLQRDFTALIDKKLRQSLDYIKQAHEWSTRLLAADQAAHDAYLNTGFSEYLIGNFPFFLKWVVKIDGVEGDKEKGLRLMEVTARDGRYMRPFAQMLLASFYEKEGRLDDSERMLRTLVQEYPDNSAIRRALERLVKSKS
jgi:hypothetical protein